jgi:hypothetical protein
MTAQAERYMQLDGLLDYWISHDGDTGLFGWFHPVRLKDDAIVDFASLRQEYKGYRTYTGLCVYRWPLTEAPYYVWYTTNADGVDHVWHTRLPVQAHTITHLSPPGALLFFQKPAINRQVTWSATRFAFILDNLPALKEPAAAQRALLMKSDATYNDCTCAIGSMDVMLHLAAMEPTLRAAWLTWEREHTAAAMMAYTDAYVNANYDAMSVMAVLFLYIHRRTRGYEPFVEQLLVHSLTHMSLPWHLLPERFMSEYPAILMNGHAPTIRIVAGGRVIFNVSLLPRLIWTMFERQSHAYWTAAAPTIDTMQRQELFWQTQFEVIAPESGLFLRALQRLWRDRPRHNGGKHGSANYVKAFNLEKDWRVLMQTHVPLCVYRLLDKAVNRREHLLDAERTHLSLFLVNKGQGWHVDDIERFMAMLQRYDSEFAHWTLEKFQRSGYGKNLRNRLTKASADLDGYHNWGCTMLTRKARDVALQRQTVVVGCPFETMPAKELSALIEKRHGSASIQDIEDMVAPLLQHTPSATRLPSDKREIATKVALNQQCCTRYFKQQQANASSASVTIRHPNHFCACSTSAAAATPVKTGG